MNAEVLEKNGELFPHDSFVVISILRGFYTISLYSGTLSLEELLEIANALALPDFREMPAPTFTSVPTETPAETMSPVPTETPAEAATPTPTLTPTETPGE